MVAHLSIQMSEAPWTLTGWAKKKATFLLEPLAGFLARRGVRPNHLTIFGVIFSVLAGAAVAKGHLVLAGWLFLFSGPFDALDGALARSSGRETAFGAFLDSFMDRYSEAALLFGVLYWSAAGGKPLLSMLVFLTLLGSLMVSYARARAEGLGFSCLVGFFTRMERFIVLVITLLSEELTFGFAVLALLTNLTAFQRLFHIYKASARR